MIIRLTLVESEPVIFKACNRHSGAVCRLDAHGRILHNKALVLSEEIDKLRLRTTASLLSGRKDIIVVSSVSCLYGMADPRAFGSNVGKSALLRN